MTLRQVCAFLKPILFNDFFLVAVIVCLLYLQVRFVRIENENLMVSVQSFVFDTLQRSHVEHQRDLQKMRDSFLSFSSSDDEGRKSSSDDANINVTAARKSSNVDPCRTPSSFAAEYVIPSSIALNGGGGDDDDEKEDDEEDNINDDIRFLFNCISNDEQHAAGSAAAEPDGRTAAAAAASEPNVHEKREDKKDDAKDNGATTKAAEKKPMSPKTTMTTSPNDSACSGVEGSALTNDSKAESGNAASSSASNEQTDSHPIGNGGSSMAEAGLAKLKLQDLKKMATDRGVDAKGTKEQLVARLKHHAGPASVSVSVSVPPNAQAAAPSSTQNPSSSATDSNNKGADVATTDANAPNPSSSPPF